MSEKQKRFRLPKIPAPPQEAVAALIIVAAIAVFAAGASAATQAAYKGRIYPHVAVGGVDVGGLGRVAALEKVQQAYDDMLDRGLTVTVGGETQIVPLRKSSEDISYNLLDIDVSAEVNAAYAVGRTGGVLAQSVMPLLLLTVWQEDGLRTATADSARIEDAIREAFPNAETPAVPTDFVITAIDDGYDIAITEPVAGTEFVFAPLHAALAEDMEDLRLSTATLTLETVMSTVTVAEAKALTETAIAALEFAPYTLAYTPETRVVPLTWDITATELADWLIPGRDDAGVVVLTLDSTKMESLLATIHAEVDVSPQDALFAMENNRVTAFTPSHDGVTVNNAQTITAASAFLGTDHTEVLVVVDRVEPNITTAESNTLGIQEMLGQGYSGFRGSPGNRIKNIRHGAEKLNGILVAPGETLSLLEALSPITLADGYLSELVIKGDEIKPEVGGGLCQIGTTTFRAVMNSGLKVIERRNHSLVVSYYNDPGNNNPGTDATIYEPSPDFKFQNDYENYVLLTTEMDEEKGQLYFTFWGTSDGRTGSYEPPTVLSWSGYGETQYKESDTLAPGVTKCQSPHPGATTTFTYHVVYGDGTTFEEEFTSSYRSLPQICLVGKTVAAEEVPTDAEGAE